MLTAVELNNNDEAGLEGLIGSSSMQHVPAGVSFNGLIRGDESLGARMEDRGIDAVPSPANPGPGIGLYFSNKNSYIAKTYRDVANVLGLYFPLLREGVDDDQDCGAGGSCVTRRTIRKVARAILEYYQQYYGQLSLVVRKPVFGVSDQVRHKPGCTTSQDG